MRIPNAVDKKHLGFLALLVLLITSLVLIWLYYDRQLESIEKQKNEIEIPVD